VYSKSSVDAAVASLNSAVHEAIDRSIPRDSVKGSNFPSWFSRTMRHYILKNNYYYRRFKKNKSDFYYSKFPYYRKLVKITINSDRSRWLKSIDESLKNNPKKLWNYVSNFRKNKLNSFQLVVDGTHLAEPHQVAEAFANHFKSVYDNTVFKVSFNPITSFDVASTDNLSVFSVTGADARKAIRRLKPKICWT
jgi:phage anti-repressor protein